MKSTEQSEPIYRYGIWRLSGPEYHATRVKCVASEDNLGVAIQRRMKLAEELGGWWMEYDSYDAHRIGREVRRVLGGDVHVREPTGRLSEERVQVTVDGVVTVYSVVTLMDVLRQMRSADDRHQDRAHVLARIATAVAEVTP